MVIAHVLGRGAPGLAGIGPRLPLLPEEDIVFFGYDEESGFIDPPEREALQASSTSKYPLARTRSNAAAAAADDDPDGSQAAWLVQVEAFATRKE